MGKLNVNSRIHKYSLIGLSEYHETLLNQAVLTGSDVTFNKITAISDVIVGGDLTVNGTMTTLSSNVIEMQDNIIEINAEETGPGVTLNLSGLEVNRGSLTNHQVVFRESDDTWRVGEVSATQAVATREDAPLINGIMTWNDSQKRLDSSNQIDIDIIYAGSNPTSKSSGGIRMTGGIGIENDAYIGGTLYLEGTSPNHATLTSDPANNLLINAPADINMTPGAGGDINVPTNIGVTFGTDSQKIESNGTDLVISSGSDIDLTPGATGDINIPSNIGLTFGTDAHKIESDSTDLTIVTSNTLNLNEVVLDVNASGAINLDAGASSQFTSSAGNINVDAIAGNLVLDGNSGVDMDSTGGITMDTTDTINGVKVATEVSGVPVVIGNLVSETTIGDNLTVNGDLSVAGNTSYDGPLIIDATENEAFLVRKDLDGGDIFIVDTTDSHVTVNQSYFDVSGSISGTPGLSGPYMKIAGSTFTDNATAVSGTASGMVFHSLGQPTLESTNATVTTTDAATLYIAGAPIAGTNQTITNAYSLWTSGDVRLDDSDLTVTHSYNGVAESGVLNKFAGANSLAELRLENDGVPTTVLFMNSSARTVDGGVNTTTLRNNAGTLRLQSSGASGISISTQIDLEERTEVDATSTEAFVVRKDSDGGDVFIVDSTNSKVKVLNEVNTVGTKAIMELVQFDSLNANKVYSNIESEIVVNTAGAEESKLVLNTVTGGLLKSYITLNGDTDQIEIPVNTKVEFGDAGETIQSDGTDLIITSGSDINLNATADINIPVNVGLTFANDTNKVETDGTDLTIEAGNVLNVNGGTVDINSLGAVNIDSAAASQFTTSAGDITIDSAATLVLDGNNAVTIDSVGGISIDSGAASNFNTSVGEMTIGGVGVNIQGGAGQVDITTSADIDMNATTDINMDTISGVINIGTGSAGRPVSIGHATSEVTVNDNLTVTGDLTVNGTTVTVDTETLNVTDNLIVLNAGPTSSADAGVLTKRYQTHTNAGGGGDVLLDAPMETSSGHGGVSGTSNVTQIVLNAGANATDDYYNGWWIKIVSGTANDNVRRIKDYNGTTKTAEIYTTADETATPQSPPTGADFTAAPTGVSYELYDCSYSSLFFDESGKEWVVACTSTDPGVSPVQISKYNDLHVNSIVMESPSTAPGGTFEGVVLIDHTDPETFLIRKNGDTGDIFRVDTTNAEVTLINPSSTVESELVLNLSMVNSLTSEYIYSQIASKIKVNTGGAEDSQLILRTNENSALSDYLVLDGNNELILLERKSVIDSTSSEALLVRKNSDSGDILTVDTSNSLVKIGGETSFVDTGAFVVTGVVSNGTLGPHLTATTSEDTYPNCQVLNYAHDDISISFDAYYNEIAGSFRSSDLGSNYQIRKNTDQLQFNYSSGVAQGSNITPAIGFYMDTTGNVTYNNDIIYSTDGALIKADTTDTSDTKHLIISGGGGGDHTRGAHIELYGNENASNGDLYLEAGNNVLSSISLRTNGSDKITISNGGTVQVTSKVQSGTSSVTGSSFNIATETFTDNATAVSGTAAVKVFTSLATPTLESTNATVTTTDAATLYIAGAPIAGTNQTITNAYSLWVDSGASKFDGDVVVESSGSIGGSDLAGAHLLVGNTTTGLGIDTDEIFNNGGDLSIGTIGSNSLLFKPGGATVMNVTDSLVTVSQPTVIDSTNTEALLVRKNGDTGDIFAVDTTNSKVTITGDLEGLNSAPSITVSSSDLVNVTAAGNVTVRNSKMVKMGDDRTLFATFEITPIAGAVNTEFRFSVPGLTTVTNTYDIIASIQGWLISNEDNLENMICLGAIATDNGKIKFTSVNTSAHMIQVVLKYTIN